ncbi:MAG: WbuC family cupin fold metalloprotein [Holophagales bacterium]|nr:WbuC family cupin fold metalloprotein [Holophagales bacterium]MBK9968252.1 WbuC family cupin fold metalloprotein [Holophagales bacterium]
MRTPDWLTRSGLDDLSKRAAAAPRRRLNRNLHVMDDPVHRLFNAIEPGSWVRPHRHLDPPRSETVIVVAGALGVVLFDGDGTVTEAVKLEAGGEVFGVDLDAGTWHGLVALAPGTVFFETKPGPYVAPGPEDRAPWAPGEGEPGAEAAEESLRRLFDR